MKTSELTGAVLDWAVAKCEGASGTGRVFMHGNTPMMEAALSGYSYQPAPESAYDQAIPPYSTNWSLGGPIIEREGITLVRCDDDYGTDSKGFCNNVRIPVWAATTGQHSTYDNVWVGQQYEIAHQECRVGPTPLIAAMRCYVASKLGDEVDVPEGL